MNTHGVEVLNGADNDAVVGLIAHHLHLKLFPADERLFNKQFAGGRGLQAPLADGLELLGVVGNATARTTQGKARTDHHRKARAPG